MAASMVTAAEAWARAGMATLSARAHPAAARAAALPPPSQPPRRVLRGTRLAVGTRPRSRAAAFGTPWTHCMAWR
eukprot:127213-Chlamydomonas_euryale.AAC.2